MRTAFVLLVAAGSLVAAPVPKDFRKAADKESLVGAWKSSDGTKQWYEFKGDGTMKTWNELREEQAVPYLWTIDPTATPKRMTLTRAVGSGTYDCLYDLTGDGLKLAFILDKTRPLPDKLAAAPGLSFYDLAREKPAK